MATTAVFAEMLVAGIEAVVWIVLLALAIAQPCEADIHRLAQLKDWVALIAAVLLAIAYGLGIVIDRLSDSLFDTVFKAYERRGSPKPSPDEDEGMVEAQIVRLRLQVLARNDKVTDFIEYIRSRLRVVRSTTFNLALTTIAMEAFLLRCTRASEWQISVSALLLASLTALAAFSAVRIRQAYEEWLIPAAAMDSVKRS